MSAHPIRETDSPHLDEELLLSEEEQLPEAFDAAAWRETVQEETPAEPGARQLLSVTLGVLGLAWVGFTAWLAGSSGEFSPTSIAQWVAIASGPLALLALVWIMFGRTRRRESEAFTRSVVSMKGEARALEVQLLALTQAIADGKAELTQMMSEVDRSSTERAEKLATVTASMASDARTLAAQGEKLDTATTRARSDMDAILEGMPQAETRANALAERLEQTGVATDSRLEAMQATIEAIGAASVEAEEKVRTAAHSLEGRLGALQDAGGSVETLMTTSADALEEIRSGIDTQAAAVAALVSQAQAGIERTGADAADRLTKSIGNSDAALAALSERITAQDASGRQMLADLESGLAALDASYARFAEEGDQRAEAISQALAGVRERLNEIAGDHVAQTDALDGLSQRTQTVKSQVDALASQIQDRLVASLHEAETGAGRLLAASQAAGPMADAMKDATEMAAQRIEASAATIEKARAALADLDENVGGSEARLTELRELVAATRKDADALTGETGPALVDALVRVREAASKAGERAREAIAQAIPESANQLGDATSQALQQAFEAQISQQLANVDAQAARAIEAARAASDRLSAQMISIGQTAAALEEHMTEIEAKEDASEEFARRVAVLMESMNSAAIDVGKILAEDVDEKSWNAYLKGERGVFTRRAVKLISNADAKAIGQHWENDPEFRDGANRYIHDFEAMLRRLLATRDGDMIAVTLMSSDMGKLYAALAQAVERRI
ncbi:hypothetical protein [Sphingomicrobium clamense]|uniref:ATPase n=1 Tax=Sphingomicrobium clamense TaxID=2851013 RepID=A0ABS6V6F1_9SPHN|nr:hypothetical protein [Sphingomicrobium sp. B8]MBW0144935.1 hypothetical protein [Sphingomicrobium sp. B8]